MRAPATAITVGVFIAAASFSAVDAMPSFLKLIPGSQNVPGVEAIGHVLPGGGGERNEFGQAFDDAGKQWNEALCYKDSDDDGQFNGAELGDPCCEWAKDKNEKLAYTTATAPGDKTSKQDPAIWAKITCANGESPETKYKAYAKTTMAPLPKEVSNAPASIAPAPSATAPAAKSSALKPQAALPMAAVALVAMGIL